MFREKFLKALSDWQNGWREDQEKKKLLASQLVIEIQHVPKKYKTVEVSCYRKRFIHKGELLEILLKDQKSEGFASWTTDLRFAEQFKGLIRENAATGVIFEHTPEPKEVILNISSLWNSKDFCQDVEALEAKETGSCKALLHFKDSQGEVILNCDLRGSEVKYFTGISSPFDELCHAASVPEAERARVFRQLIDDGVKIQEPCYTPEGSAQDIIARTMQRLHIKVLEAKSD